MRQAALLLCLAAVAARADDAADAGSPASGTPEVEQLADEMDQRFQEVKEAVKAAAPGNTHFLLSGYGFGQFDKKQGPARSMAAGLALIALWQLSDRLFTEAELEVELGEGGAELGLEYVNLTFAANDYLFITGGLMLAPVGTWAERYHAPWINKLPDAPLGLGHDALVPESILGLQARGALPLGPTKLSYSLWVAGGGQLNLGAENPKEAGQLSFATFTVPRDVAFGGQVGFYPLPTLELDYSIYRSGVGAGANATVHAFSGSWFVDSPALKGTLDLRAEALLSFVDAVTYDPAGELGLGPLRFDNRRIAGYVQAAYRPTRLGVVLDRLELVVRGDLLVTPVEAPESEQVRRLTTGLDVWVGQSTALKLAYQLTRRIEGNEMEATLEHGFKAQLVMGF